MINKISTLLENYKLIVSVITVVLIAYFGANSKISNLEASVKNKLDTDKAINLIKISVDRTMRDNKPYFDYTEGQVLKSEINNIKIQMERSEKKLDYIIERLK